MLKFKVGDPAINPNGKFGIVVKIVPFFKGVDIYKIAWCNGKTEGYHQADAGMFLREAEERYANRTKA